MRRRGAIERGLQERDHGVVRRVVGPVLAHGRHLSRAQLADDLFPHLGMFADAGAQHGVQREVSLFVVGIVAGEAVGFDDVDVRFTATRRGRPTGER